MNIQIMRELVIIDKAVKKNTMPLFELAQFLTAHLDSINKIVNFKAFKKAEKKAKKIVTKAEIIYHDAINPHKITDTRVKEGVALAHKLQDLKTELIELGRTESVETVAMLAEYINIVHGFTKIIFEKVVGIPKYE